MSRIHCQTASNTGYSVQRLIRLTTLVLGLLTAGGTLAGWGASLTVSATPLRRTALSTPAEDLVLAAAGLGLTAVGAWLCLGTLVCLTDLARRTPTPTPGALRPGALRRALLRAWGPAVGAAVISAAGPVAADPAGPEGLPLPDRPVLTAPAQPWAAQTRAGSAGPAAARHAPSRHDARAVHPVRPGDCLWSIAADLVGPSTAPATVDRAWRVLYGHNRALVGPDPDLVRPGVRLVVPRALRQFPHPSR